jgi:hypothetical protein
MVVYFQYILWKNVDNISFYAKILIYHPHARKRFIAKALFTVESNFFCSYTCRNMKSGNKRSGTNRTLVEGWWYFESLTCTWDWWELLWSSFLSSSSHSCSKLVSFFFEKSRKFGIGQMQSTEKLLSHPGV